jgi:hypothetical protein
MIRVKSHRFVIRCDSKGRSGSWECENLSPPSENRDVACECAKGTGWIMFRGKWYCPECQRDGFVPRLETPHRRNMVQPLGD